MSGESPMGLIVRKYRKEGYSVLFNPLTGFFARIEEKGQVEPFWSIHGPELIDVSLTNWCSKGCGFCYRRSNSSGKHMGVNNYRIIMEQARKMGVLQVALGGGNPNQHPSFAEILQLTREEYGIVPSYTTNGMGLTREILEASRKFCGAVAVSAYPPFEDLQGYIRLLIDSGIKTNIHFLMDDASVETAIGWLRNPPKFLDGINAVVFLNYKPVGRGSKVIGLLKESDRISEFFRLVNLGTNPFKIGFDSCSISGLVTFTNVRREFFDACEAGRFSMFISEDMKMFPCSFMTDSFHGIPISKDNIVSTWQSDSLFVSMRKRLKENDCKSCKNSKNCFGGCPIFPQINLCQLDHLESDNSRLAC